jgi:hypothetical protein
MAGFEVTFYGRIWVTPEVHRTGYKSFEAKPLHAYLSSLEVAVCH